MRRKTEDRIVEEMGKAIDQKLLMAAPLIAKETAKGTIEIIAEVDRELLSLIKSVIDMKADKFEVSEIVDALRKRGIYPLQPPPFDPK